MVELVDTLALGASASRRGGSSPSTRTKFRMRTEMEMTATNKRLFIAALCVSEVLMLGLLWFVYFG